MEQGWINIGTALEQYGKTPTSWEIHENSVKNHLKYGIPYTTLCGNLSKVYAWRAESVTCHLWVTLAHKFTSVFTSHSLQNTSDN